MECLSIQEADFPLESPRIDSPDLRYIRHRFLAIDQADRNTGSILMVGGGKRHYHARIRSEPSKDHAWSGIPFILPVLFCAYIHPEYAPPYVTGIVEARIFGIRTLLHCIPPVKILRHYSTIGTAARICTGIMGGYRNHILIVPLELLEADFIPPRLRGKL